MACQIDVRAKAAGKGHLGRGDRQAAFAQVVTGADQSGVDRAVHRGKGLLRDVRIELGNLASPRPPAPLPERRGESIL